METLAEINKGIAEFMGLHRLFNSRPTCNNCKEYGVSYTESLDALIPVLEKLGVTYYDMDKSADGTWSCVMFVKNKRGVMIRGATTQEAAARATYKDIQEIN